MNIRAKGYLRTTLETYHGLIAAILTILAAVLSALLLFASASRDAAIVDARELEQQVDTSREQVDSRDATIDDLTAANDSLSRELSERDALIAELQGKDTPSSSTTPSSAPPEDSPSIRNSGTVTLASWGDYIDLNHAGEGWADAVQETNWVDTIWYNGGLGMQGVDVLLLPLGEVADYARCRNATGYAGSPNLSDDVLSSGTVLCVRTDSGRFGTIHIVESAADAATLEITTWEIER